MTPQLKAAEGLTVSAITFFGISLTDINEVMQFVALTITVVSGSIGLYLYFRNRRE